MESTSLFPHFSFWPQLTSAQQTKLLSHTNTQSLPKGSLLHSGNADCMGVLLVQEGSLRVYLLSEDGREVTLYRLRQGELCMLSASCVLEAITFDIFIEAETPVTISRINAAVFQQIMEENIYLKAFSYQLIAERFSDVMWRMQQILFLGIDRRLACFLLEESASVQSPQIHLTQEQLAKHLGTAREVVSRMLKYFVEENMVTLFRGGVTITDEEKLRRLAQPSF